MGKNKHRQPGAVGGGVKFHTGRDLSRTDFPVFFILAIPGIQPLTTYWSPSDAEGIAMAILKQVELSRRYLAEPKLAQTMPVPVSPIT